VSTLYESVEGFMALFKGLDQAFGTGEGRWVKRPPKAMDYLGHLEGKGPGIGIAPLMPDNRVWFASIDLDEPDFEGARTMQKFIPGTSWLERSRSGNAHIHVFFKEPIEAWVPMGILKYAVDAAGFKHVEVFPKNHDFSKVQFGNYINLPYHGDDRPILSPNEGFDMDLETFVSVANYNRQEPRKWRQRAGLLLIEEPKERARREGKTPNLHMCAEYIIGRALSGEAPIGEGHRTAVYFALAKQLRGCSQFTDDEAWDLMVDVNAASPDPMDPREMRRQFINAAGFTSTGCDDPLVAPFAHPDCPIAKG